ncbi:unnamed protein product [marine sediment metagenome]|uniref:Uncharacterized protein n=1 Tax=marine sediment metagenome TaxID=412755 RepID=X1AQD6_9ZZZZ
MGIRDVAWKTMKWKIMKKHLGYSEDEMRPTINGRSKFELISIHIL